MPEKEPGIWRVAVVDTLTSLQNDEYMGLLDRKTMVVLDHWRDFSVNLYAFVQELKKLKCTIVLVLGSEGSGKSWGVKELNPNDTLWIHADDKPLPWVGASKVWNEEAGNLYVPKGAPAFRDKYTEIENLIKEMDKDKVNPKQGLIVFLLGHVATYEAPEKVIRERMKTLGNMAGKMNVEGAVVHCYYTYLEVMGEEIKYKLRTRNTGKNTGRSPGGMLPDLYIDNNFQIIVNAIEKG